MKSDDIIIAQKITVESVLRDLEKVKGLALDSGRHDKHGNPIMDLATYTRATELEGKYLKMFTDKIEVDVDGHSELVDMIARRIP